MATKQNDTAVLQTAVALVQVGDGHNMLLPWDGQSKDASGIEGLDDGAVPTAPIIFGFLLSDVMSQQEVDSILDRLEADVDLNAWQVDVGEIPAFGPEGTDNAACVEAEASWQAALDKYVASQKEADKEAKAKKTAKQTRAAGARKAKATKTATRPKGVPEWVDVDLYQTLVGDTQKAGTEALKSKHGRTIASIRTALTKWLALDADEKTAFDDADVRRDLAKTLGTTQAAVRDGNVNVSELPAHVVYAAWVRIAGQDGLPTLAKPKTATTKRLVKKS